MRTVAVCVDEARHLLGTGATSYWYQHEMGSLLDHNQSTHILISTLPIEMQNERDRNVPPCNL